MTKDTPLQALDVNSREFAEKRINEVNAFTGNWPENMPAPVSLQACRDVLALPPPAGVTEREGLEVATRFLQANWPWLTTSKQDLRLYVRNLAIIFANHTRDAARHVTNPQTMPNWRDGYPPSPGTLRKELENFDARRRCAERIARYILDETEKRRAAVEYQTKCEADRRAFREKYGDRNILDVIRERMRQGVDDDTATRH